MRATPSGAITVTVDLPGDWGAIGIAFGVDATGVRLVVTPEHAGEIQLLPTVSASATCSVPRWSALVPRVLQEITDALAANATHPVLDVALDIAEALDIYDPAAGGFVGAAQAEQLRHMLDPGWLEAQVTDPALLVGHIRAALPDGATPGSIALPARPPRHPRGRPAAVGGGPARRRHARRRAGVERGGPPAGARHAHGPDTGPVTIDGTARLPGCARGVGPGPDRRR